MKKLIPFILLPLFTLTSCRVNWFTETYDVPWFYIALPVAVIAVAAYLGIIRRTYICPHCRTEFKPKWYHFLITIHINDKRLAKCPNCRQKSFCQRKKH